MSFINTIPLSEATGDVRELYERQQAPLGFVPNYAKVFSHRPNIMKAWAALQSEIKKTIEHKNYNLATLASARAIGSTYCSLAYANLLKNKLYSTDELKMILEKDDASPLTEGEQAIMALAEKVALNSSSVTQNDIEQLKTFGYDDGDIFDIVASAAARCFFAKLVDGLGGLTDAPFGGTDEKLSDYLIVGREVDLSEVESI